MYKGIKNYKAGFFPFFYFISPLHHQSCPSFYMQFHGIIESTLVVFFILLAVSIIAVYHATCYRFTRSDFLGAASFWVVAEHHEYRDTRGKLLFSECPKHCILQVSSIIISLIIRNAQHTSRPQFYTNSLLEFFIFSAHEIMFYWRFLRFSYLFRNLSLII